MSLPCTVIEAGPGTIRQLLCGETTPVDPELVTAALDGIDDPVALVDDRPVAVDALWRAALRSAGGEGCSRLVVVHPSWWAARRVELVRAAAGALADHVVLRPRSSVLARATPAAAPQAALIVEITDRIVVVTGTTVVAEPRRGGPQAVADAVSDAIAVMTPGPSATVLIDTPVGVGGAGPLAEMIVERLRISGDRIVVLVDDARLRRLATAGFSGNDECDPPSAAITRRRRRPALVLLAVLLAAALCAYPFGRHGAPPPPDRMPTTFLVEGRVAVEVPAHWPTQRVIAGPGSARVQATSPSNPQVALDVTQSPVVDQTLAGAAESLKHAIDAEPPGVFVDFNPSGSTAGRPAVTYREVRVGHDIWWVVLLDRSVRIGIGCQSRPGDYEAVRDACELAVRSARAVD